MALLASEGPRLGVMPGPGHSLSFFSISCSYIVKSKNEIQSYCEFLPVLVVLPRKETESPEYTSYQ